MEKAEYENICMAYCKPICWNCDSTFMLKRQSEGVALCLQCRIKEHYYFVINKVRKTITRNLKKSK